MIINRHLNYPIIENKNLLNDYRILQCLRNNPLYEEINEEVINEFLKKTERVSIREIIAEIPLNLLSKEERNSFMKGTEKKKKINGI